MFEAVAAAPTSDELLLDGAEPDSRVLVEQHVDVVERERADMGFVELLQRGS